MVECSLEHKKWPGKHAAGPPPNSRLLSDYLAAIGAYTKAGCDHIILNQVGPDQDAFFAFFEKKLAPALHGRKAA